ncbi:MAG: glutamate-5-semialdehyde dehydrogenase [Candidatus Gastranaerophilales bacterium]|nr:glutamate-5-semialdehyde dehydrogenase [Candidatus Gastranaerophilales bacterium]
MNEILEIVKNANSAKNALSSLSSEVKNRALLNIENGLIASYDDIFKANALDLEYANGLLEEGKITKSTYNRLKLDENKMRDLIKGIKDVQALGDPVNKIVWTRELDENLILKKITCPIGLIGVIFEARPDVLPQITALAVKSGNALILKGGKEALNTNKAFFKVIENALNNTELYPKNTVNLLFSHDDVKEILNMDEYIDLIIPRGSNKLVRFIQENTKIPVLGHASGICHIFINEDADTNIVNKVVIDSKTQYPSACNSVETVLVHKNYPDLPGLKHALTENGVKIIENPERYDFEYSDKILALKVVNSLDEAILHINKYGSHHTDSILTENNAACEKFMSMVDSAGVYHNVSTRFSDGFRYGFGAEVGISTNKTLARGPVGIEGLCIYKYRLYGSGQIVADYANGTKQFHHKNIFGL